MKDEVIRLIQLLLIYFCATAFGPYLSSKVDPVPGWIVDSVLAILAAAFLEAVRFVLFERPVLFVRWERPGSPNALTLLDVSLAELDAGSAKFQFYARNETKGYLGSQLLAYLCKHSAELQVSFRNAPAYVTVDDSGMPSGDKAVFPDYATRGFRVELRDPPDASDVEWVYADLALTATRQVNNPRFEVRYVRRAASWPARSLVKLLEIRTEATRLSVHQ